ncbi:MAG TPA: asparagine synthase (glutamine-hydrolyzing) [Gemmatimonadales bacterium]|nr:asparagine synthase (glutamine-hydrolyzing) [Gemmatimonadales bacterium]
MCGLAGLFRAGGASDETLAASLRAMTDCIVHRGPDDGGTFTVPDAGVGLGFRRLAIIDLSPMGHQPMASGTRRFTIVFNGEVFNHNALREELRALGHTFRGHSDTEVILAAFESWGIAAAVRRFVGMFAIAAWDAHDRSLTLIRDRLGIKPMHYWSGSGMVAFASELKSLVALPEFDRQLNRDALASYLRYLYVPAPSSIYQGVRKLPPGHFITIRDPAAPLPAPEAYWSALTAAHEGSANRLRVSDTEAVNQLDQLLSEAIRLRLESDVPLGALLSAGIDSTTVVSIMQGMMSRPVRTFTIGFDNPEHDETEHARAIAKHIGTDHTELHVSGRDALDVVPLLPDMFDEPLADPSQIPTYLVSKLARQHVTVALSGDGGDEVFAGYNRYRHGAAMARRLAGMPRPLRRAAAAAMTSLRPATWDTVTGIGARWLPSGSRPRLVGERVHKMARLLGSEGTAGRYRTLMSFWDRPADLVPGATELPDELDAILEGRTPRELEERMMLSDQRVYLADDLLAKVDRASMAVSLEARVPLLDHRVVEFGWRIPLHQKIRDGEGKWILRQVLYRRVPKALMDRPKTGFTVPIADWLRGPLREWAEELLLPARLADGGVLNPVPIRAAWSALKEGRSPNATGLWAVLQFQDWRRRWSPRL